MNNRILLYVGAVALVTAAFATSAFSAGRVDSRVATAAVVGDSAAYLAIYKNTASPHAGFVSEGANGKIVVNFGSGTATGTGMNPDSIYEWDDIIKITNQGTGTVYVKVVTSSTTGNLTAAIAGASGSMTDSNYTWSTTPVALAVGSTLYLGLKADSTGLSSGQSVSGTFTIYGTRTSAGTL